MKYKLRRTIGRLLCVVFVTCNLAGCRIGDTEYVFFQKKVNKKIVFSVNDSKCSINEAKLYLCNYKNLYGNPFGIDLWEQEDASLENYVKDVAVSQLSKIFCMDLLAQQQGISLDAKEQELIDQATREYYDSLSEAEIDYMDLSVERLKEYYEHYALAVKLYKTLTVGVDEEVSDDEARVITIMQIFVSTEEKRLKVEEMLAAGDVFSIVASTYNELDTVEINVGRKELPMEVEAVAFELDNDTYSEAIAVENGYYFVYCINKYNEELTEANKGNILIQREKEQFNDLYDAFVESAEFQFNYELWDTTEVGTGKDFDTDEFFTIYEKYFGKVEELL